MENGYQVFSVSNLREILTVIFKHRWKVLLAFLVIFLSVIVYVWQIPRVYEAKSVLLVKFGREYLLRPEEGPAGSALSVPSSAIMSGEISILTSRSLLSRVVSTVGPGKLCPALANFPQKSPLVIEAAIRAIEKNFQAKNLPGTSLIEVSFEHTDPNMAATVVNLAVNLFKEKHLEVFSSEGNEFLENQMKISQKKLNESESNLADFKKRYQVFSLAEQKSQLLEQRTSLDSGLKATQNQIIELEQKIRLLKERKSIGSEVSPDLKGKLVALEQKERELLGKYTENSRVVQAVRQEIQSEKDSLLRNADELRQIEIGKAEMELSLVKARMVNINRQMSQVTAEIQSLDARGRELQDLQRVATESEQSYQTYVRKLEESVIMSDMDRRKMIAVKVVENATAPAAAKKHKPEKRKIVMAGFFGGVIAAVGLAFLIELLSSGMTTPHMAERRLGVPVMVAIARK